LGRAAWSVVTQADSPYNIQKGERMLSKISFKSLCVLIGAVVLFSVSCQPMNQSNNQKSIGQSSQSWELFVNEFLDAYFAAHPDAAVRAGRHEFDGRLPDWSTEGIAGEVKRLLAVKDGAHVFSDTTLDEDQRYGRDDVLVAPVDEL